MAQGGSHPSVLRDCGAYCFLSGVARLSARFAAEPKRVMLLHSFGRDFKPWSEYAKTIRTELDRQSPWQLDIIEFSLVTARFSDENPEAPFIEYLRVLFAKHPLDLIVSIGAPAANFVQRHRRELFLTIPMIFTTVEQRRIQFANLTENDTVVAVAHDFPAVIENILRVLPETKTIAVVNGNSSLEKLWLQDLQKDFAPFSDRVSFIWWNDRSFEDILKQASALPPHSAIFWHLMNVDAAGVQHEGERALAQLYAVANAPIFSFADVFFGREIVGGPMHSVLEGSRETATAAIRILGGEKAGDIKIPPTRFAAPKFDWREMQRWGISENRLPSGSEVLFRNPTVWEQYRWQILLIAAVLLIQTLLIMALLYEHQRRRRAEVQSLQRMTELAHLNRVATAGELSASIAHEVKQPLAAIVVQCSAGLRWLAHATPDINEARDALNKIMLAGKRASEIVDDLRTMFRKESTGRKPLDINTLLGNVIELTRHDAQKHGILVHTTFFDRPKPQTLGDQTQIEQVFLNLVMNAIEAMSSSKSDHRVLELKTSVNGRHEVLVTVADNGAGVGEENLEKIFDAFFTTKPNGMGMGLSICRTIIESHEGSLTAVPNKPHGMEFRIVLPIAA